MHSFKYSYNSNILSLSSWVVVFSLHEYDTILSSMLRTKCSFNLLVVLIFESYWQHIPIIEELIPPATNGEFLSLIKSSLDKLTTCQ